MRNQNKLLIPNVDHVLQMMKEEIAEELGINYGADATSRENGRIGGEITKRLVKMAQEQLTR